MRFQERDEQAQREIIVLRRLVNELTLRVEALEHTAQIEQDYQLEQIEEERT